MFVVPKTKIARRFNCLFCFRKRPECPATSQVVCSCNVCRWRMSLRQVLQKIFHICRLDVEPFRESCFQPKRLRTEPFIFHCGIRILKVKMFIVFRPHSFWYPVVVDDCKLWIHMYHFSAIFGTCQPVDGGAVDVFNVDDLLWPFINGRNPVVRWNLKGSGTCSCKTNPCKFKTGNLVLWNSFSETSVPKWEQKHA